MGEPNPQHWAGKLGSVWVNGLGSGEVGEVGVGGGGGTLFLGTSRPYPLGSLFPGTAVNIPLWAFPETCLMEGISCLCI